MSWPLSILEITMVRTTSRNRQAVVDSARRRRALGRLGRHILRWGLVATPRFVGAFALTALAATTGCYRYAAAPVTALAPGMTVRVELSAAAVDRFRKGPDSLSRLIKGFQVGGEVSRLSTDSLLLVVPLQFLDVDARLRTLNHDLLLFRQDMQRAQIRRLHKKRTTWLAVALGAATAASVAIVLNRGGRRSGGNDGPVDPPPEIRVPFSFRLPVP